MTEFAVLHPYLRLQLQAGQLFHAYIFSGKKAEEQAMALAAALECLQPLDDASACAACHACRNNFLGIHPDVRWLEPQGAQHKVEAMRDLISGAGLSRLAGFYKIYILKQAENISMEAANTLLKLLEEPVENTLLILLTEQPDQLLPTIISRCQHFSFGEKEQQRESRPELLEAAEAFLAALPEMPVYQVLLKARDFEKDRSAQSDFLFAMLECLHKAACFGSGLKWSPASALEAADLLEQSIGQLERGINQKLLVEVSYLRLRQICAR
ncbi:MAG: hypothetical protein Q4B50_05040 [Bacillota bacterium]|nr:hypothetical protein [Bacillota bacterium]